MNPIEKRKELMNQFINKNKNKKNNTELKSFKDLKININSDFIEYYYTESNPGGGNSD